MPVYVHEVVIRAVIAETAGSGAAPDQADLVETCVEQVLEILAAERER